MKADYYIGLMSGTSADGIDAALVSLPQGAPPSLVTSHFEPLPTSLKQKLVSLFSSEKAAGDVDQIDLMGEMDAQLGCLFANACCALINKSDIEASQVRAIGSHGQTIRHRPTANFPFTLQIGNPHIIAQKTGIPVVADFRRRDMALGGQGAPLAPAFHRQFLSSVEENRVILNVGGISNITWLRKDQQEMIGFDTGPGNGLMDAWVALIKQLEFDRDGLWASSGEANPELVALWLEDPYFSSPPPKSTGKEYFHLQWATNNEHLQSLSSEDVQASLLELTVISISDAIKKHCNSVDRVLVCGGGAHNSALMKRLQVLCECPVQSTEQAGMNPDWVEAMAFAWLAKCHIERQPLDFSQITGSTAPTLLGALYPA